VCTLQRRAREFEYDSDVTISGWPPQRARPIVFMAEGAGPVWGNGRSIPPQDYGYGEHPCPLNKLAIMSASPVGDLATLRNLFARDLVYGRLWKSQQHDYAKNAADGEIIS